MMFDKETAEEFLRQSKNLTPEKEALLKAYGSQDVSEKEMFEKLGIEEKAYGEFLKSFPDYNERAVFNQTVSAEELAEYSGGDSGDQAGCLIIQRRSIYYGAFPNCAATVEDGSFCDLNDACFRGAVEYYPLYDCHKAWK